MNDWREEIGMHVSLGGEWKKLNDVGRSVGASGGRPTTKQSRGDETRGQSY